MKRPRPKTQPPQEKASNDPASPLPPPQKRQRLIVPYLAKCPPLPPEVWVQVVHHLASWLPNLVRCMSVAKYHPLAEESRRELPVRCKQRLLDRLREMFGTRAVRPMVHHAVAAMVHLTTGVRVTEADSATVTRVKGSGIPLKAIAPFARNRAVTMKQLLMEVLFGCALWFGNDKYAQWSPPHTVPHKYRCLEVLKVADLWVCMIYPPTITSRCECCLGKRPRVHVVVLGVDRDPNLAQHIKKLAKLLGMRFRRAGIWSYVVRSWTDPKEGPHLIKQLEALACSTLGEEAIWAGSQL